MVEATPDKLKADLLKQRSELTVRISALEKQEQQLRSKFETAQARILKGDKHE